MASHPGISVPCAITQHNPRYGRSHPTEVYIPPVTYLPQRSHSHIPEIIVHVTTLERVLHMPATSLLQWSHIHLQDILVYVTTWLVCVCRLHPSPQWPHTHLQDILVYVTTWLVCVCRLHPSSSGVTQTSSRYIYICDIIHFTFVLSSR
jgi:hypothetical protein